MAFLALGAVLLCTVCGKASSQPLAEQPSPAEQHFKQLDKNGDGKITPDELTDQELFKKIDANGDGSITLEEMNAYQARPGGAGGGQTGVDVEQRFKQMDKNGDGKITPDEFPAKEMFQKIDADGDGVITLVEMKAFFAKQAGGQGGPGGGNAQVEAQFKRLDKNGDGNITPDELPNAEMFKRIRP